MKGGSIRTYQTDSRLSQSIEVYVIELEQDFIMSCYYVWEWLITFNDTLNADARKHFVLSN